MTYTVDPVKLAERLATMQPGDTIYSTKEDCTDEVYSPESTGTVPVVPSDARANADTAEPCVDLFLPRPKRP